MDAPEIRLADPDTPELLAATREILREYAASLEIDLCFQNFEDELATLPGEYAAPSGCCCWPWSTGALAGCGAFRALTDVDYANACEMKRLYVRPRISPLRPRPRARAGVARRSAARPAIR